MGNACTNCSACKGDGGENGEILTVDHKVSKLSILYINLILLLFSTDIISYHKNKS
jgi:hypothetical protein